MSEAGFVMNWIIIILLLRPYYKRVVVKLNTNAIKKHQIVIKQHQEAIKKLRTKANKKKKSNSKSKVS